MGADGIEQVRVAGLPATATGGVLFTVTVTLAVELHPQLLVTVKVYVVVVVGVATGLEMLVEESPVAGLQAYVKPLTLLEPMLALVVLQVIV